MQDFTDVPFDRPSVGAMGPLGNLYPDRELTKRYVYRGTGVDTLTAYLDEPKPRKRRKHDPAKIRAANIKRFEKRNLSIAADAAREAQRTLDKIDNPPKKKRKKKRSKPRPAAIRTQAPPRPSPPWRPAPAPGWTPLTGADVDTLLEELGVDDATRDANPAEQAAWRDQAALLGVLHFDGGEYL